MDGSGELAALAAWAAGAAADVRGQVVVLRTAGDVPWRGAAAAAFAQRLEELCSSAVALAAALDDLDDAVRLHAARARTRADLLGQEVWAARALLVGAGPVPVLPRW